MKLLGVDVDTELYKSWVMQVQRRQQSTSGPSGSGMRVAANGGGTADKSPAAEGLEKLKWFLGLPNNYYSSEWKESN